MPRNLVIPVKIELSRKRVLLTLFLSIFDSNLRSHSERGAVPQLGVGALRLSAVCDGINKATALQFFLPSPKAESCLWQLCLHKLCTLPLGQDVFPSKILNAFICLIQDIKEAHWTFLHFTTTPIPYEQYKSHSSFLCYIHTSYTYTTHPNHRHTWWSRQITQFPILTYLNMRRPV